MTSRRRSLGRYVRNAASLVSTAAALRATSFVIYLLTARYLGAFKFGQLSLAATLFAVFVELALLGTKTLVTREVARDRSSTGMYLVNANFVVVVTSAFGFGLLWAFVRLMGYDAGTAGVTLIMAVGVLPAAVSQTCEGVMQAWERMHLIAYVNVPVGVAKVVLAFLLLHAGFDVLSMAWLFAGSYAAMALVECVILVPLVIGTGARLQPGFALRLVRMSAPFFGIAFMAKLKGSIVTVLLSKIGGEVSVGLYNAARQLVVPLRLVYSNLVSSVFPAMCRKFDTGAEGLRSVTRDLIAMLLTVTLPVVLLIYALAEPTLRVVYGGDQFMLVTTALRIIIWLPLFETVTAVLGQVLWASGREMVGFRIVFIDTLAIAALGVALIYWRGITGAAAATTMVAAISVVQHYVPVVRMLRGEVLFRSSWKPLVASAVMALFLAITHERASFAIVLPACLLYLAALVVTLILSAGGLGPFRRRYIQPWL